jgi:FAD/FMN-containing dehydrogenase
MAVDHEQVRRVIVGQEEVLLVLETEPLGADGGLPGLVARLGQLDLDRPAVLLARDAYDEARLLWNGAFDRRPAVVVRCLGAQDVSAAVTFARTHGLELAVRGGGHSTGGLSGVDDGLMVDLSAMNQVETDVEGQRCRVGGGATLGQRDGATQEHGLATTAGIVGHTGVGGLTLTGGMGWLTRKHGLALDNVLAVQIVTADGKIRRASADEEPLPPRAPSTPIRNPITTR